MTGKLGENILSTIAFAPAQIGAATVYYNGTSLSDLTADGIDTRDADNAVFVLSFGTVQGAAASIANAVYESDTNLAAGATLVTGASFTAKTAGEKSVQTGLVKCKDLKRYLWLRTEITGAPVTAQFSSICNLGKVDSVETKSGTDIFDV